MGDPNEHDFTIIADAITDKHPGKTPQERQANADEAMKVAAMAGLRILGRFLNDVHRIADAAEKLASVVDQTPPPSDGPTSA